eukprot:2743486-Amphidinium_carterae.1
MLHFLLQPMQLFGSRFRTRSLDGHAVEHHPTLQCVTLCSTFVVSKLRLVDKVPVTMAHPSTGTPLPELILTAGGVVPS